MKLKNSLIVNTLVLSAALVVAGCQSYGVGEEVKPHIRDELARSQNTTSSKPTPPPQLNQELLAEVARYQALPAPTSQKMFAVSANNVDVRPFFDALVEDTPYSVAVHPAVSGQISLTLKEVALEDVLTIISRMYPLDVFLEGKVIQVMPSQLKTESIPVNFLMIKRFGVSNVSVIAGGVSEQDQNNGGNNGGINGNNNISGNALGGQGGFGGQGGLGGNNIQQLNGSNIQTTSENDFWSDLKEALKVLVSPTEGRQVVVSPQAGLVTVRALPSEIAVVKDFLNQSQESLQRQVVLEARIIEVTLNDGYQQGVRWDRIASGLTGSVNFGFSGGAIASNFAANTAAGIDPAINAVNGIGNSISTDIGGVSTLRISRGDFDGVINMLQTQGDVQMLSNPRVTVTNNQKAVIKVGQDEYFVTDVSTSEDQSATQTENENDIELTPFFSGIALDVTPQIDRSGSVILHVHPSVTETAEQTKVIQVGDQQILLPLAQSNIRESDTVIRARDGEIVVIGGLMETVTSEQESKTPLLGDIPFIGNAFKNKAKTQSKRELVILIRPSVVQPDTWEKQRLRTQSLLDQWYRN
ncbi:pilus (MSHA type) biogenesis protein MshL [Alteromonas macleodii]|jgi:MSHA biogenesis protein MshL|uniref:Mannose-sensitive agglutinin biogenesis protein MshL n=1 Tax=Alteromonas macleodii (strain English Channel 673) TaxID=1004788 RepID=A0AB32ZTI1_ALTME|nr:MULTISPECIES: pilus (MSHA type) biogenesis protein MshL [Alteromonas]MEC7359878.1 pilus (MSHA type) biogenesis protein MshL [Pseudomonadota bacterium]AFS35768.1 putative mannose-sensitive agglutinin biogenesis protein MshL [Alteromonas macleodii ATCC 27126]AFT72912.1 putative mannose-sensitive agglutinin biogenesis protein MshL [Alteromonas macleodii str. 'English Channel 673']AFT93690.1 putative mannose-sensitive agglutinin biogenesis protein MshL [Alteromonas macleodii str. 'Balearic Sea A|tara:strand:+ start:1751 stop:3499 length:1749 start_codon:yes stop_codon:yes gene_type:complete